MDRDEIKTKYGGGVFKTCPPDELQQHTADGWTLVEIFQTNAVLDASWREEKEGQQGYHSSTYIEHQKKEVALVSLCLLRQDPDSAVAKAQTEAHRKVAEAQIAQKEARRTLELLQDTHAGCDQKVVKADELLDGQRLLSDGLAQKLKAAKAERAEERQLTKALQRDQKAVRNAIGSERWDEIVAPKKNGASAGVRRGRSRSRPART